MKVYLYEAKCDKDRDELILKTLIKAKDNKDLCNWVVTYCDYYVTCNAICPIPIELIQQMKDELDELPVEDYWDDIDLIKLVCDELIKDKNVGTIYAEIRYEE